MQLSRNFLPYSGTTSQFQIPTSALNWSLNNYYFWTQPGNRFIFHVQPWVLKGNSWPAYFIDLRVTLLGWCEGLGQKLCGSQRGPVKHQKHPLLLQALGWFSCIFNYSTVIKGLSGIRGKLWLIEISISCRKRGQWNIDKRQLLLFYRHLVSLEWNLTSCTKQYQ